VSLLTSEIHSGLGLLTLNDPTRRNVISSDLSAALIAAFDGLEARADVSAIIITGAGAAFCAGARLEDLAAVRDGDHQLLQRIYSAFLRVANSPLPTIAAVNGPAVGAGMNLALACDVRLAAHSARFDTRFMRLGLHPGGGHTWMLHRAVGWQAASAMLLFGSEIDGPSAEKCGLAWRAVADHELIPEALRFGARASSASRGVLIAAKNSLRLAVNTTDFNEVIRHEMREQLQSMQGEAFSARLENVRRKPVVP
jgi:enoyl-CoA hydratase